MWAALNSSRDQVLGGNHKSSWDIMNLTITQQYKISSFTGRSKISHLEKTSLGITVHLLLLKTLGSEENTQKTKTRKRVQGRSLRWNTEYSEKHRALTGRR